MPGVVAAIRPRSTSGASGSPRVWTFRIASRPARSGGCTATRRSKRPGRSSAWSSTSGRLVAPITITLVEESNPSISVRIWFSVCSRSSLPPLKPAAPEVRERPIASSSSMKTIAGAASFAWAKRSRTREAPTPTIASTNSEAACEKNGTLGLARDRPRQQRLAGPGRAGEQHAVRDPAAELLVLLRMAEEVDDLGQLRLRLFDPGDVRERDAVARDLIAAGARAAELAEHVLDVSGAADQREEQQQEQERRPEAEQEALPPGRALVQRLRVDDDALLLEQRRERVVVRERRHLGLELRRRLGALVALLFGERPLDRRALRGDLLHVPGVHLLEEERAVRDADARRRLGGPGAEVDVEGQQREAEQDPATRDVEARPRRRCSARSRRRRGLGPLGGRHARPPRSGPPPARRRARSAARPRAAAATTR